MENKQTRLQTSKAPRRAFLLNTKGLAVIVTGAVVIVALVRAKQSDIPVIVKEFLDSPFVAAAGWFVAAVILIASIICFKVVGRDHSHELDRLAKERDRLQSKLLEKCNVAEEK